MDKRRAGLDLFAALVAHVCAMPFWLIVFVGIGTSVPNFESRLLELPLYWFFNVGPFLLWGACGAMLIVWWWQGRRPVWRYPIIWGLAFFGTIFTLVLLLIPDFRRMLRPPTKTRVAG
jgi:hypothetical protein